MAKDKAVDKVEEKAAEDVAAAVDTVETPDVSVSVSDGHEAEVEVDVVSEFGDDLNDTILLEDGGRVPVHPGQHHSFRVQSVDGQSFDHCSQHSSGEWVYRVCG